MLIHVSIRSRVHAIGFLNSIPFDSYPYGTYSLVGCLLLVDLSLGLGGFLILLGSEVVQAGVDLLADAGLVGRDGLLVTLGLSLVALTGNGVGDVVDTVSVMFVSMYVCIGVGSGDVLTWLVGGVQTY